MKNTFKEEDLTKFVEFLNMVATNAEFTMKTADVIKYFNLLAHMQKQVLPKIKDNIFEIKSITEASEESSTESESKGGKE